MDLKELYEKLLELLDSKAAAASIDKTELQDYFTPEGVLLKQNYLERLASSLQNSGMMHNSIRFNESRERRELIKSALCDFDGKAALDKFNNAEELYNALTDVGRLDAGLQKQINNDTKAEARAKKKGMHYTPKKHLPTNWQKYANGLFDGLKFLYNEKGIELIDGLCKDPTSENELKSKLKTLGGIEKRIHGLGFALCCDWIKECGARWLAKPDVHIKVVASYAAQNEELLSDQKTIEFMYSWATEAGTTAYELDKVIWLICTGNFYLKRDMINRDSILKAVKELQKNYLKGL